MMQLGIRSIAFSFAAAAATLTLSACSAGDGSAALAEDLRDQLDGSKVCAMLIAPQWPIEQSAELLARPGIGALIAAELVHREGIEDRVNATPRAWISITETGKPFLRLDSMGNNSSVVPYLCFGERQVTVIDRGEDGVVRYRYRIVDAPVWTERGDMRTAFPFLARLIDQEQRAEVGAVLENGHWRVALGVAQATAAELGNTGFFPAPTPMPRLTRIPAAECPKEL